MKRRKTLPHHAQWKKTLNQEKNHLDIFHKSALNYQNIGLNTHYTQILHTSNEYKPFFSSTEKGWQSPLFVVFNLHIAKIPSLLKQVLKPHFLSKSPQIENEVSILTGLDDINHFNPISYDILFRIPSCRKNISKKTKILTHF